MDQHPPMSRGDRVAFGLVIFLGAFLLFQMQPLIGKYLLPWFGGAAGVWTICLLFFQCLLLAGYLYAHLLTRHLQPRAQAIVHGLVLLAALATMPLAPDAVNQPDPTGSPVGQLLALLAISVGLPFLALAATGPLLQAWFSRLTAGQAPWRFYALSNAGSLLALVSYPFLVEPYLPRGAQSTGWGWGLALFALACGYTAWRTAQVPAVKPETETDDTPPPCCGTWALWLLLPACGTALLMATTSKICLDVAPVPFLWVLPLAIYLLSFIVAFDNPKWYSRTWVGVALGASWLALAGLFLVRLREAGAETDAPSEWPLAAQVAIHGAALFIMCLICHGELFRLRPKPARLTQFYLAIAGGGALGGLAVGIGAPAIFSGYWEYPISAWLCGMLMVIACFRDPLGRRAGRLLAAGMVGFSLLLLAQTYYQLTIHNAGWGTAKWRGRNFYGVLTLHEGVAQTPTDQPSADALNSRAFVGSAGNFGLAPLGPGFKATNRVIIHGNIVHGLQFTAPPYLAGTPTIYYGPSGAAGRLLQAMPSPRRVGVVGLGVGTLATYGRAGDVFRFYEINPAVVNLARKQFSFLRDCKADEKPVLLGDARLVMQSEDPQRYDVLILDAFSSDAIPVHLLTKEAFDLYKVHLNPDRSSVIAVHISNRHLDLHPVLREAARAMGLKMKVFIQPRRFPSFGESSSTWALLCAEEAVLKDPIFVGLAEPPMPKRRVQLWTDEYASLLPILK